MLDRLVRPFTSLRLTVTLLGLGAVLIFWGTLAQVDLGLYKAQNEFFRSFFIYWHGIPVFPGGYLLGGLLLINLFAAHLRYYQPGKRKFGIAAIHLGIVQLLLGQFATDIFSQESSMHIREGQTVNYSEATRNFELAVIDKSDDKMNKVVAIPERMLRAGATIAHPEMPFTIQVKTFFPNATLSETKVEGMTPVGAMDTLGSRIFWRELPHATEMNDRDTPSGVIEIITPKGSLGTWLVSGLLMRPQEVLIDGKRYELALRPQRFYRPFSLHLLQFRFDRYAGTDIPKNFSSRVRLVRPETKENREVLIYMNNPLRYSGETFYQADWDKADEKGTVLQVVHNPGWLTPYLACFMVAGGLIYQFLSHLFKFIRRRNA